MTKRVTCFYLNVLLIGNFKQLQNNVDFVCNRLSSRGLKYSYFASKSCPNLVKESVRYGIISFSMD